MFIALFRFSLIIAVFIILTLQANAQGSDRLSEIEALISKHEKAFGFIEKSITSESKNDAALVTSRGRLEDLQRDVASVVEELSSRLGNVDKEIQELGAAPTEDASPEPQIVADKRSALGTERSALIVLSNQGQALIGSVQTSIDIVAKMRRDLFANSLIKRTPLDTTLFQNAFNAAKSEWIALNQLVTGWWRFSVLQKMTEVLLSTLAAILLALGLSLSARFSTGKVFQRSEDQPTYFAKLARAFWRAVIPSFAFITFFASSYGLYTYFEVFTSKIDLIVAALFPVLAGIILVRNLAVAIFSPNNKEYRLIATPDISAHNLVRLIIALAAVNGLDIFVGRLNEVVSAPLALTVFKSLVAAFLIGILLIIIARVKGRLVEIDGLQRSLGWPRLISVPFTVIGVAIILAAFSGYIGLARFLSQQVVITGAILTTMYIGILIGREVGKEGVFANTAFGQFLTNRLNIQTEIVDQISVVVSLLTTALVILIGLPLLFLQWGSQWEDVSFWLSKLFFGFEVGNITLSLSTFLIAIAAFITVYLLVQVFRRWLDNNVLVRSRMDSGVRDSIKAGIGYVGLALALLFAITTAGIDLSSLAIVAGALSLGIGFGLQNIVSNFVSGLILLIERPIKVGDWVEVGGTAGHVKKISVRATEITTFQKQSIIVPNSELINSVVGNWTHKDKGGRIDIPIGVAYGTNTRRVETLLLEIAKERNDVLRFPESFVIFIGFGESSLDFELRVFLRDIGQGIVIASEIRHTIAEVFERESIEIPFPQRDLNIKSLPVNNDPLSLEGKTKAEVKI